MPLESLAAVASSSRHDSDSAGPKTDDALRLASATNPGNDRERRWLAHQLRQFPRRFWEPLIEQFVARKARATKQAAEEFLWRMRGACTPRNITLAASDDDVCRLASTLAKEFASLVSVTRFWPLVYSDAAARAAAYGLAAPAVGRNVSHRGAVARLQDEKWLRRAIRRSICRSVEAVARTLGFVSRRAGLFVSDESLARRRDQRSRIRRFLAAWEAISDDAVDAIGLDELAEHSITNPAVRRAEFLNRVFGFEKIARELGHSAVFLTMTCPGRMHATLSGSGTLNPTFDDTSPAESQKYLCRLWARARAKLGREGVRLYGFRIAEPHHDGTPHWHMLLFVPPDHEARLVQVLRKYALADDGDEPGSHEHRFSAKQIDYRKGTAIAYLAKYVSKNLDAYGLTELDGRPAIELAERASAWASTWGIRQFQQIGGPPVTIWRELRRLSGAPEGLLAEAFTAADNANWCEFVRLTTRSLTLGRTDQPLKTYRLRPAGTNAYHEVPLPRVVGVQAEGRVVVTRAKSWEFQRKDSRVSRAPLSPDRRNLSRPQSASALVAFGALESCQ